VEEERKTLRGCNVLISGGVLVLVDGCLLSLLQYSSERINRHLLMRTALSGNVIETIKRLTRHLDTDLGEDFTQLYRPHVAKME